MFLLEVIPVEWQESRIWSFWLTPLVGDFFVLLVRYRDDSDAGRLRDYSTGSNQDDDDKQMAPNRDKEAPGRSTCGSFQSGESGDE